MARASGGGGGCKYGGTNRKDPKNVAGIVFFGVGFYMELCRVIYLQPGSLDVSVMFHNGSSCVSRQVDIILDWGDFAYLKENKMAGDTDFSAYINFYVQNTELKNRYNGFVLLDTELIQS